MNAKQEIVQYIKSKEVNGALLLTGKWGCGKSYVINQICQEMNTDTKKEYVLILVSLFGIESLNMMDEAIKIKFLYTTTVLNDNTTRVIKGAKDVVANLLKGFDSTTNGVSGKLGEFLSLNPLNFIKISNQKRSEKDKHKREIVLIFDDFERCDIKVSDLLGKINEYVETEQIKTIIIADEDKINDQDGKYREFKEKVIFRTIKLAPDYHTVISEIANFYTETIEGYHKFILDNLMTIIEVFQWSKSENLRILKTILIDYERVFQLLSSLGVSDTIMAKTLYEFGIAVYRAKGSKTMDQQKENEDDRFDEETINIPMLGLKNWIETGIWDEKSICEEFKRAFIHENETDDQKILYSMIWDLDDKTIQNGLPIVIHKAYAGDLSREESIYLIDLLDILVKMHYTMPCDFDYTQIENGLINRIQKIKDGTIIEPPNRRFIDGGKLSKMDPQAQKIYSLIYSVDENIEEWNNRQLFLRVMRKKLATRVFALINYAYVEFDLEMANSYFEWYSSTDNATRRDLARALYKLYFKDFHNATKREDTVTYKVLSMLNNKIVELKNDENESITKWVHNSTADALQRMMSGK